MKLCRLLMKIGDWNIFCFCSNDNTVDTDEDFIDMVKSVQIVASASLKKVRINWFAEINIKESYENFADF